MKAPNQRKIGRILFDEFHSESWSVSEERAREMQPEDPVDSSYGIAAHALMEHPFIVHRNIDHELRMEILSQVDVLALVHPCDPKWEKTTSGHSPRLSSREIINIHDFVRKGGSLIVLSEYEHDKYGDNLNDLLAPFGLKIENTTVVDHTACIHENPTWIFAEPTKKEGCLSYLVRRVCFYRAASCKAWGSASIAWWASESAHPHHAGLMGMAQYGEGRVVLMTDSSLFGDRYIREFDHLQLWLNLIYWCSAPTFFRTKVEIESSPASRSRAWFSLKSSVNQLRFLQNNDGSIVASHHSEATKHVQAILKEVHLLGENFPHQTKYLHQLPQDFQEWLRRGFQKPDFGKSLAAFNPQLNRRDHIENLVIFPLYTPNASGDIRFEAMILRVPWPDWLAELEKTAYRDNKFVPGHLVDFTDGYCSECAVLFPETISLHEKPTNNFSIIFCDREAKRLQRCAQKATAVVHLELHPQLECFLGSLSLIQDAMALWDLIHDQSHSVGELPFDPFMIRRKAPYWMYALEELRVDLRSFCEAVRLAREGFSFAHNITYAIFLDRVFRFPITGSRIRNYDALGGQLLFAFLHQHDVVIWLDNRLAVRWELLPDAVNELREKIAKLYKLGADCSKMNFWLDAHDLVSSYVSPNIASKWKRDSREIHDENDPRKWIDLVHDDEFPLGNFHIYLLSKMSE